MKVDIKIDDVLVGNPRRGYHAYEARVVFVYHESTWYTPEREKEIIDGIFKPSNWMWYTVTETEPHTFTVVHGYDSGD